MQRIDSFGAVAVRPTNEAQVNIPGFFNIGNPATAIPATVVTMGWCNDVQEELLSVIEGAGLTATKGVAQLFTAIKAVATTQAATFTLANNQSSLADVTGMLLNGTLTRAAIIECIIYRKDAAQERLMRVKLDAFYKPVAGTWELLVSEAVGDDPDSMGVNFSITAAGQVQYTTSNFAGGSYVGELRYKISNFKA